MIIGIDTSNIRAGGGITHLSEVLKCVQPYDYGFKKVIVWAGVKTLSSLCDQSWLEKVHVPILDGLLPQRIYWQQFMLPKLLKQNNCSLLFSPGGILPRHAPVPTVTMSRNLLPFEPREMMRYKFSLVFARLYLLHYKQSKTFHSADGIIFLTRYASSTILKKIGRTESKCTVIPHGVDSRFVLSPRVQKPLNGYTNNRHFRFLYVSIIDVYKHQWHVAEAIAKLKEEGIPVELDLVGPAYPPALKRLQRMVKKVDPREIFIHYHGYVSYSELPSFYHQADAFIFASSCENMPNILLEAMAAGLPIVCARRGPMPEILGDAGVYFDPEQPEEIANAMHRLLKNPALRDNCAWSAFKRAQQYSWERCAKETFLFLKIVAQQAMGFNTLL